MSAMRTVWRRLLRPRLAEMYAIYARDIRVSRGGKDHRSELA